MEKDIIQRLGKILGEDFEFALKFYMIYSNDKLDIDFSELKIMDAIDFIEEVLPLPKLKIPRKLKKKLKKGLWLYPKDENGNSLMASPTESRKDLYAYRKGILRNLNSRFGRRKRINEMMAKLKPEIYVTDEELKDMVIELSIPESVDEIYNILIEIKEIDIKLYFEFINAYNLYKGGDNSYGNICFMVFETAKMVIKK